MKFRTLVKALLCCGIALLCYGFFIEPNRIEVRHLRLEGEQIHPEMEGLIGVHISDLHMGRIGKREERLLSLLAEIKPHILFLTGDYVKWRGEYGPALAFLSRLSAPLGVWAVMGDYEYSDSRQSCLFCHEKESALLTRQHGVRFVDNRIGTIEFPGGSVPIAGFSKEYVLPMAKGDIRELGKSGGAIILSHNPLVFDKIHEQKNVLILAGDTHGGQLPLPSWLFRLFGYEKNACFNQGFFKEGTKRMYVNRGIGTSHLPIRILRRPELLVIHF